MKIVASLGLLTVLGFIVMKLALGPFYARYDERECQAAYARAHSLADTLRVDLHPYASRLPGRNPRCGETRAVIASGPLASPRQPSP